MKIPRPDALPWAGLNWREWYDWLESLDTAGADADQSILAISTFLPGSNGTDSSSSSSANFSDANNILANQEFGG